MDAIRVIDRETGCEFEENVAGSQYLQFLYKDRLGRAILEMVIKHRFLSFLYGKYQDSPLSKKDIQPFIDEYKIPMEEYERQDSKDYLCFNDFFARKLHLNARPIETDPNYLVMPGDGRVSVVERFREKDVVQIKGVRFHLFDLFFDEDLAQKYRNGSLIIVRLCPVDYHRFHFPAAGIPGKIRKIHGDYYSVNPWAIEKIPNLFCENERHFLEMKLEGGQEILLMDVGATMVGKIHQTYRPFDRVEKGQERGYFEFGASTTLVITREGEFEISDDLIQNSKAGRETLCKMGSKMGRIC